MGSDVSEATMMKLRIWEAYGDYLYGMKQLTEKQQDLSGEAAREVAKVQAEGQRRIGTARAEGVMGLQEQGAQSAYESRMAMTRAELTAGAEVSRLGKSGVRMGGSPLLAAQQNVDLAYAAADRTAEQGRAGMAIGGLRLKNELGGISAGTAMQVADINAEDTLLTRDYQRRIDEMNRKFEELQKNSGKMLAWAMLNDATAAAAGGMQLFNASKFFFGL